MIRQTAQPPETDGLPLLVTGVPFIDDGCGYYRITLPGSALNEIYQTRIKYFFYGRDSMDEMKKSKIILFQRVLDLEHIKVAKILQSRGIVVGYEIDDNLSEIPETNVNFRLQFLRREMHDVMAKADFLTVSTEPLKEYYSKVIGKAPEKIFCVPNAIRLADYKRNVFSSDARPLRLGYAGSVTHVSDLVQCIRPLRQVLLKYRQQVQFVLMGWPAKVVETSEFFQDIPIELHEEVDIKDYAGALAGLNLDIAIAPLENNLFNRCKSHIKLLEYGAVGCAVIASDIEPYRFIQDGVHGFLVRDEKEWLQALIKLIADAGLRKQMQDNLHHLVKTGHEIGRVAARWLDVFQTVQHWKPGEARSASEPLNREPLNQ
ncbi:MAG: glycosyltransferase family 4 protein [Verrucomicrobiae bacterium]|nr:glycosyltransferase family 4 protein [Verrucomicrobiae bacterium]